MTSVFCLGIFAAPAFARSDPQLLGIIGKDELEGSLLSPAVNADQKKIETPVSEKSSKKDKKKEAKDKASSVSMTPKPDSQGTEKSLGTLAKDDVVSVPLEKAAGKFSQPEEKAPLPKVEKAVVDQKTKEPDPASFTVAAEGKKDPFVKIFGSSVDDANDYSSMSSVRPNLMEPLGLVNAIDYALKGNPEVRSFEARVSGAKWDNAGSYALYMPSVEVNYAEGAEKSWPGSYNDSTGSRVPVTQHHRRDRSVAIRQPLIDLAVVSDIMRTSNNVAVADAEQRDIQETTVFGTVSTFIKLLQARKAIELFDEHKSMLKQLADRMQARLEGGGATTADVNRVQSRLSVVEAARIEAMGAYGINIAEFKRLTKVVPVKFVMPDPLVPFVPATPEAALAVAMKGNPSYIASLKKIDVAQSDRNKSFAGALPKLSVEMSDAFVYNAGGAAHGNPVDGVYPNQRDRRIMLVAKWSLTGGTAFTSGMSGVNKVREMSWKSDDVKSRVEQGILTAYDGLNATRKRIAILREAYETDKRVVAELEEQYQNGERSLFEILDSQDRLHTTKIELMGAMFSEALTAYQIRMQMGEISQAVLGVSAGRHGG